MNRSPTAVWLTLLWLLAGCERAVELEPLPTVPFEEMGPQAAGHLRQEWERLLPLATDDTRATAERAGAFDELGRLLQAYSLHRSAAVAYRNALSLGASPDPTAYLLGVALSDLGDSEGAGERFEQLLASNPEHNPARLWLGEIRLQAGHAQAARELFSDALAREPENAAAHAGLGKAALAAGDYRQAVHSLSAALEQQPGADSLHRLLAQAHARLGDDQLAAAHQARAGDAEVAIADADLARVQSLAVGAGSALRRGDGAVLAGDFGRAVDAYRQAVADAPDDASAHHSLAAALFRTGNLADALAAYRRSAELDPGNSAVRFNIGVTRMRLGDATEAISDFRQALALEDRAGYRLGLAEALWLAGDAMAAESELDAVLAADPGAVEAYLLRARVRLSRGAKDLAMADASAALGRDDRNPHALLLRALASEGDTSGGLEMTWEEISDPARRRSFALAAGEHFAGQQRWTSAIEWLERALEIEPDFTTRLRLADLQRASGDDRAAAESYRALAAAPDLGFAHRRVLARRLAAVGACSSAEQILEADSDARAEARAELVRAMVACGRAADDPRRVVRLASDLVESEPTVEHVELLAMVYAAVGRFDLAASWQQQLIDRVGSEADPEWLRRAEQNLVRFRQNRASVGVQAR